MRNVLFLIAILLAFCCAPSVTFATNLEYDHKTYKEADLGPQTLYGLATKGFEDQIAKREGKVTIDHHFIGLSRDEVLMKLGEPQYRKGKSIDVYFTEDKHSFFPIVIIKYKNDRVRFIHFPISDRIGLKHVSRTRVEEVLGTPEINKSHKMVFVDDNQQKKVTITWTGFVDKECTGVYYGKVTDFRDRLRIVPLVATAKDKLEWYRLDQDVALMKKRLDGFSQWAKERQQQ